MPSPFQRLLQEAVQTANTDPEAAANQRDSLLGKAQTADEAMQLAAFNVNLVGAALGRWDEAASFSQRVLEHPALDDEGRRSVLRGLAVLHSCRGDAAACDQALTDGATNDEERCRYEIMCAQTLVAARRPLEAVPHLHAAANNFAAVPAQSELIQQTGLITDNIMRLAEGQIRHMRHLLLQAAETGRTAWSRRPTEWRNQHRSIYHLGKAAVQCGNPARALRLVQELLQLEAAEDAGPQERLFSAELACDAQLLRCQIKIAGQALVACKHYRDQLDDPKQIEHANRIIDGLEARLNELRQS